jgi:hypothetical protein
MASTAHGASARMRLHVTGRHGLVDKYFYFAMSLLFATIVVVGFSQTIKANLFQAAPPRPFLLWIHGVAFSGWVVFYIFQSALVRTHNVKWHRFFGWFGAGLGTLMVLLGVAIAVIMGRFDAVQLHTPAPTFLSVPWPLDHAWGLPSIGVRNLSCIAGFSSSRPARCSTHPLADLISSSTTISSSRSSTS